MAANFGGTNYAVSTKEMNVKDKSSHILVCTMGRLLHLLQNKAIDGSKVRCVVVDECDIMLSKEKSRDEVRKVIEKTDRNKQVMMFTATLDQKTK